MSDVENDFCILLSDVARHMRTYGNWLAQRHGVTLAQVTILERLEHEPGISQNELAVITEFAPMTVARLVDRLEALGLLERCGDSRDRRMWRLRLTPAAAPLARDIQTLRARLFLVGTRGINASVLGTMAQGLRQMKQNVSAERLSRRRRKEHHHVQNGRDRRARTPFTALRSRAGTTGLR